MTTPENPPALSADFGKVDPLPPGVELMLLTAQDIVGFSDEDWEAICAERQKGMK